MNTHQIDNSECPSNVIVNAVAAHSDTPVVELEPLYDTIDPEALDLLIKDGSNTSVSFEYQDCSVAVDSEKVRIED